MSTLNSVVSARFAGQGTDHRIAGKDLPAEPASFFMFDKRRKALSFRKLLGFVRVFLREWLLIT